MVWESGNEAFAAFSLAGLAVVMSLFFCTGTGKEPMRQAFGGWAAIDGCFEARDTQKNGRLAWCISSDTTTGGKARGQFIDEHCMALRARE